MRTKLLDEGKIFTCRITPDDLGKYLKAGLVNAMQVNDNMQVIAIDCIR